MNSSYLNSSRSDKALDFGCLGSGFLSVLLRERSVDDVLPHIIFLAQVEQLPDLSYPLGSKATGLGVVGQSGDLGISLLHDDKVQNTEIEIDVRLLI